MEPYRAWGEGDWGLGNEGDEVLLLNGVDQAVDVVVYGTGAYPTVVAHPGGIAYGHSLQRYPAWLDSDDCRLDFRDWPYPSPGERTHCSESLFCQWISGRWRFCLRQTSPAG